MVVLLIAFRAHRGDAQADTHPVRSPEKLGTVHFATPAGLARLFDRDECAECAQKTDSRLAVGICA